MDNAFGRVGTIRYSKQSKGSWSEYETLCPLAVIEPKTKRILYLEFAGSDSVVSGLSAALHSREKVTITLPDGTHLTGCAFLDSDDIQSVQERIDLHGEAGHRQSRTAGKTTGKPAGKGTGQGSRQRRHPAGEEMGRTVFKAMFTAFDKVATDGFVPILSRDPREVIYELAERLALPVESHWAAWLYARLGEIEQGVTVCDSFGLDAVIVRVRRADLLGLISTGIKSGALRSKTTAPRHLRTWGIRDLRGRRLRWIAQTQRPTWLETSGVSVKVTAAARMAIEGFGFTAKDLLTWQATGNWGLVSETELDANQRLTAQAPSQGSAIGVTGASGPFRLVSRFKIGGKRLDVVTSREAYGRLVQCRISVEGESVSRSIAA